MTTYQELAAEMGFAGTDEKLIEIGMAIELGAIAWDWYAAGNDKYDVAAIFQFRDEDPNEEDTIAAYAEGAAA